MIRGLPQVLSYYLPGQEYGNIPYAVRGGFGIYTGMRPDCIAKSVGLLLRNESLLSEMRAAALSKAHPEATQMIAKDIVNRALSAE